DYTYDSTGRLTQVDRNSSTYATYSYDDNNNRTGGVINGVTTTGVYDTQDRMTDYNTYDFTYGANGEMLTKTNTLTSVVWTYTYDVEGNLLSAASSSPAKTYNYEVDGLNRRIEKRDGSTFKARYLYDTKNRIIAEINSNRTLKRRYVYVSKQNIPDYFYEGSAKFRIISDHLGSPRLVIKQSDGSIKQVMDHDAFGCFVTNTIDTSGSYTAIPFGFAGGLFDANTNLLRYGARDYDCETGRWLSKDPILFDGGDTNLFGYVQNDPINWIDVNGLEPKRPGFINTINIDEMRSGGGGGGGFSPFRGKSPQQIDTMFRDKGFQPRGPDPVGGKGGYVNPNTGRSYHIDFNNRFNEPAHVDVNRPGNCPMPKRKFPAGGE
ncbi:MAG: RHS repeat-associated core domain-containing protein, partial [Bdellovibrionota bacterium]